MLCVCVCVCVFLGSICLTFFLLRDFFFHLFCILLLSCHPLHLVSLHSCTYTDFFVSPWSSLIIFDHLFVSRVKLSSFLYPLSIMTKRRRNCGEYVVSFFKILHVWGRNTFLCKGEMCFILLGGVLTSLFLYIGLVTIYRHSLYLLSLLWCWCMFFFHLPFHVLFFFSLYTHTSY